MADDKKTTTSSSTIHGPVGSKVGGVWYKKSNTAITNDWSSILCCLCMCDCSLLIMMCCPLSDEFVYQDPPPSSSSSPAIEGKNNNDGGQIFRNEKGHILSKDNIKNCMKEVTSEELEDLQSKYNPSFKKKNEMMNREVL